MSKPREDIGDCSARACLPLALATLCLGHGASEMWMPAFSSSHLMITQEAVGSLQGNSQETVIGAVPTCPDCRVVVEPVVTLGSVSDPNGPAGQFVVTMDSRGRSFVAPLSDRASVGLYSSSGEYRRAVGRSGEGPGEYRYAQEVKVLPGDTIVVIDRVLSRYTVYAPNLEVTHVQPIPFPDDGSVFFSSRDFVGHASVATPNRIGFLLHHFRHGDVVRSFAEAGAVLPGDRSHTHRRIARSSDGTIWLAHENRYLVEKWDTTGVQLKALRADRSWFPPGTGPPAFRGPMISSIWEDENGLLFVMVNVPTTPHQDAEPPGAGSNWLVQASWDTGTFIEVIDPSTGALITRYRSENLFHAGLMDVPGLVETREEDEETGWLRVTVWRVGIDPLPGGNHDESGERVAGGAAGHSPIRLGTGERGRTRGPGRIVP